MHLLLARWRGSDARMKTPCNYVMTRALGMAALAAICVALTGCGGGGGGGGSGDSGPPPVNGPAWGGFGRDAQHSALGGIATQALARLLWNTAVDQAPQYTPSGALLIHYGSPVISAHNTVIVPVRTANGGVRIEARAGANGVLLWSADSDYVLRTPMPSAWTPSYGIALTPGNRLYFAGAGGKIFYRDDVDNPSGVVRTLTIPNTGPQDRGINAALTVDAAGTLFLTYSGSSSQFPSRVVRVLADGTMTTMSLASFVPLNPEIVITSPALNSAPAVSADGKTLYIVVISGHTPSNITFVWYLVALDANTLEFKSNVVLRDPVTGGFATVSQNSSASPTVGPDGDVYFGVLESQPPAHNFRGWLLHFDATLATTKAPASFGWDDTASVVPATMVPSYTGASPYLLAIKYNNYGGAGTGDGKNLMAIVDPSAVQTDTISGQPVMKEILTILGPTPDKNFPGGVREWCVNTVAVDPFTRSVLVNSEDGMLYRWSLVTNTFTEKIRLGNEIGEAYTPTVIGPNGVVYAINNAIMYAVGQ